MASFSVAYDFLRLQILPDLTHIKVTLICHYWFANPIAVELIRTNCNQSIRLRLDRIFTSLLELHVISLN
jgi:hypothetical protein